MRFSQRIGKIPIKTVLQVESIDDDLRNRLWNVILEDFFDKLYDSSSYGEETEKGKVCKLIWKEFYKKPIDQISQYQNTGRVYTAGFVEYVRKWFYKSEWYDIYDFVEFLAIIDSSVKRVGFTTECNSALEREVAGYRLVNDKVVQITSEEEVQEIEEATLATEKWKSVHLHLKTALDMLADRKTPDYRNSIKESISAVEALCIIITGDTSATLGKALSEIEKKHSLHGALKTAFSAIYGYTSDSGGIRHALIETDIKVEFEEAKFMLVSCSAFINYLKSKMKI
jgi:AbiJ N-terminal domain 4